MRTKKLYLFLCCLSGIAAFTIFRYIAYNTKKSLGKNLLLIVNYNHPYYDSIPLLKKMYGPYFPHIVFYGPQEHVQVHTCNHHQGWFAYKTIADAMTHYPHFDGYLYIHDDLIINPKNLYRFDKRKIWLDPFSKTLDLRLGLEAEPQWCWWKRDVGYTAVQHMFATMAPHYRAQLSSNLSQDHIAYGYSDIVYIPAKYAQKFTTLSEQCAQHNVFLEIALPTICACIAPLSEIEFFKGHAEWQGRNTCSLFNNSLDYIHPMKLSSAANREFVKKQFMSIF